MKMKFINIIVLINLITSLGIAAVNMRNGSYTESWIDLIDPEDGFEMKIERFYSSRSLFLGVFGFGWCSNFETNLNITSDGIINLTECGGGIEVTYYPEDFDLKSVDQTIKEIIESISKEKKLSTNDIKNLQTQLVSNTKMRFDYANRLHLVDIKKIKNNKNTFTAKTKGLEKIQSDGSFYLRKKSDGNVEKFNSLGQLVQITNASGTWLQIHYKGKNISYMVDQKGRRLSFSYNNNGTLQKIYNGKDLEVTYQFQNENLISVKNIWNKTYTYSYDVNHNLTQVLFPDKTQIKMTYDPANDWVKSYTNRNDCREDFNFLLSNDDPKNHYWGTYTRKCPTSQSISGRHEFWYNSYSFSDDKFLNRALEVKGDEFKDIYFHPYLGRPISLRENFSYSGFAYYLNGLVNKKEFKSYTEQNEIIDWQKASYSYDLNNYRMTQVDTTDLNKVGKVQKKTKTLFSYNNRGLLERATQNKGQFISVVFASNGRLFSLENNKKEKINFIFENGSTKPTRITHNNLGEVTITYDNQGEVLSLNTENKRTVASSVIQSFLEMLSFLGPMGDILKI
jgi:hypothetical protein